MDPERSYFLGRPEVKGGILNQYLIDHDPLYDGFIGDITGYTIQFKRPLTTEELANFTTWFSNWICPDSYLAFDHSETYNLNTDKFISSELSIANTFIMAGYDPQYNNGVILSSLKTLIYLYSETIEDFVTWNDNSEELVTIQVYDKTRDIVVDEQQINMSNVMASWKAKALTGATGPVEEWVPHQMYGIDNILPNYDCIWQWKIACTPPTVYVGLNAMQRLYYNIIRT